MSHTIREHVLSQAPLLGGLMFPECPRWHAGAWWFSDMHGQAIYRLEADRAPSVVIHLEDQPAGLGWHDDTLLAVGMTRQELLEIRQGQIVRRTALAGFAPFHCNDMVVDAHGGAYIGNFGFDFESHQAPRPTCLLYVDAQRQVHVAAEDLMFPNGMVLTEDGQTLIVAESYGRCLSAFSVAGDGALHARRSFARFEHQAPDGICLDSAGGVWIASPPTREVLRVLEGGRITDRIATPLHALACMLGGLDAKTLLICSAPLARKEKTRAARAGRIDVIQVEIGHAGQP